MLGAVFAVLSGLLADAGFRSGDLWLLGPLGVLAVGGYLWGRWKALLWLGTVPWLAIALLSDVAWMTGIWDRSEEYEPLPTTPFLIVFGLPFLVGFVALGVAARNAVRAPQGAGRQ